MNKLLKRIIDVSISFIALIIFSPLFLVIALTNIFILGRPILFTQKRIGFHEKPFFLYKFRTMLNEKDQNGNQLPDEKRLSSYGKILRKYSLDELPGIINVLKNDMSLVGPRPLFPEYLDFYTIEQKRRHHVKPGITGLAQVNGRNAISWEEKFRFDILYVDNFSMWMDIKILFKTFIKVVKANDISHNDHPTMPRFDELGK
jgi:sugar transferase EpsL